MDIIDFRFRPNTEATIQGFTHSAMFKGMFDKMNLSHLVPQTVPEVVADLNEANIVKAVITGRDCETTYGAAPNNPGVIAFVEEFPEKFVGFMGFDPHKGMTGIAEFARSITEKGMHGASIDPYLAKIPANDARYYPIYAKCVELNVPLVVCTGPATLVPGAIMEHSAPGLLDYVARDFPELKVIISHGGYPWVNEAIMVVERNENVYMELSEYERHPGGEDYIKAMSNIIPDKILYASAHPGAHFKDALKMYDDFNLSQEVMECVMYKNAAKILGI